jgi:hypothetical protein
MRRWSIQSIALRGGLGKPPHLPYPLTPHKTPPIFLRPRQPQTISIITRLEYLILNHRKGQTPRNDHFDRACHCLYDLGQPALVRDIVARRIIEVARAGERDPDELCARALQEVGFGRRQTACDRPRP